MMKWLRLVSQDGLKADFIKRIRVGLDKVGMICHVNMPNTLPEEQELEFSNESTAKLAKNGKRSPKKHLREVKNRRSSKKTSTLMRE
jgi:hypothetical protein